MKTFAFVIACLLVTGAHCGAIFTYGVPGTVSVVHRPAVQPVVQRVVHQQVVQPVVHQTVVQPVLHQPVVHETVVRSPLVHQTVVRAPLVAQHKELVHVPHHEHGYTIEQSRVVQPKSTVVHHDALTGLPYQQTDYHHAPVVTGSRSSVYHSRPGYIAERTKTYIL
ncbi:uncharacterized protein [Dermacentor andersoni]|uniref:uncharacterized protein n=1 Tax=Dermacentor andersoni TaxID=34620 RepID=UPI00241702F1|nr:uncharacterized protein LOC129384320 [Dermacentor andersoni]